MDKKRIVVALGRNSFGETFPEQQENVKKAAAAIADFVGRAEHQLWASQLYADVHLAAEGGWRVSISGSCERPERAEWYVRGTAGIYGEGTADDSKRAGGFANNDSDKVRENAQFCRADGCG